MLLGDVGHRLGLPRPFAAAARFFSSTSRECPIQSLCEALTMSGVTWPMLPSYSYMADGLSAFRNVNQPADPSPTATANHNVVTRINTVALAASGLGTLKCTSRKNTVASAVPRPPGMNDRAPANEANAKTKIATGSPIVVSHGHQRQMKR